MYKFHQKDLATTEPEQLLVAPWPLDQGVGEI
jgi:hypothetical protein